MPSSPNYKRDYSQETATSNARGEKPKRAERNRARYKMMKLGLVHKGDGKDVDHKTPVSKGGTNARSNLRVEDDNANRSFPRNPNGSIKK
jgi:hypothetical protein